MIAAITTTTDSQLIPILHGSEVITGWYINVEHKHFT